MRISQSPQVALGRAIRLRREGAGLTQEALADTADLDPTFIRGFERGIANPTWDVADRIARALGLDPMAVSPWGLIGVLDGRTLFAGVCLAGEKAPADPMRGSVRNFVYLA